MIDSDALKTREELVADAIRLSILRGAFSPGEKLDQQQLAKQLGVSRSPVREALRTLSAEGLVTTIPNRSAVVTERTLQELEELYFIRGVLEGVAVERSAPHMDDQILDQMANILDKADALDDLEELLFLNNEFHIAAYSAVDQPFFMNYIQQLRNMVAPYNRLFLDQVGSKDLAWADHRRIYEACLKRDGALAKTEVEKHLEQVFHRIVEAKNNA